MKPPVFGVTGWKNSGKTTLVAKLIEEFVARGHHVATAKHAHHGFDIDKPGTDSFLHRQAGASEVVIVSARRWAIMHEVRNAPEPTLAEMLDRLSTCDLVLVEGYKRERHAKIEVRRTRAHPDQALAPDDPSIVAIAADHQVATHGRPLFDLDDIRGIADFIAQHVGIATDHPPK